MKHEFQVKRRTEERDGETVVLFDVTPVTHGDTETMTLDQIELQRVSLRQQRKQLEDDLARTRDEVKQRVAMIDQQLVFLDSMLTAVNSEAAKDKVAGKLASASKKKAAPAEGVRGEEPAKGSRSSRKRGAGKPETVLPKE